MISSFKGTTMHMTVDVWHKALPLCDVTLHDLLRYTICDPCDIMSKRSITQALAGKC